MLPKGSIHNALSPALRLNPGGCCFQGVNHSFRSWSHYWALEQWKSEFMKDGCYYQENEVCMLRQDLPLSTLTVCVRRISRQRSTATRSCITPWMRTGRGLWPRSGTRRTPLCSRDAWTTWASAGTTCAIRPSAWGEGENSGDAQTQFRV